ncbi:MAG: helix-turn-helix domain-containing protein [Bacteroidetes bacterium]|nr:helix-turn-helix domain-containing protein [Bacteroidota bacterium]
MAEVHEAPLHEKDPAPQESPERTDEQQVANDSSQANSLHPRLAWMMCYEETRSAQAVCRKFGISRKTFYKWLKRYRETNGNTMSLVDRSRRPHTFPRATPESKITLLKQAKAQTGYGQRRLRVYLEQKYNISLSERTIWKILKRESQKQRVEQQES